MYKIVHKIFTDKSYTKTNKEGKSYQTNFYCIEVDSGYSIIIQPTETRDYAVLDALCEKRFIDTPKRK